MAAWDVLSAAALGILVAVALAGLVALALATFAVVRAVRSPTYGAGLVAASIFAPGSAATACVALALGVGTVNWAVFAGGTAIGVAAWALVAVPCRRFGDPRGASPGAYAELAARVRELRRCQDVSPAEPRCVRGTFDVAVDDAARLLHGTGRGRPSGLAWAAGAGYLAVYGAVHRAEQALVELAPSEGVVRRALLVRDAIAGSKVANEKGHVAALTRALVVLGAEPEQRPPPPRGRLGQRALAVLLVAAVGGARRPAPTGAAAGDPAALARVRIRTALETLHDFRDTRRASLVRARNSLFAAAVFISVIAYTLFGVAFFARVEVRHVTAATVFFLIGAVVGLFRVLERAARAKAVSEDDYDIGAIRLVQVPVFCGIAAIGGVALAGLLGLGGGQAAEDLGAVFDLRRSPQSLVVAAVFGFTPTLVSSTLRGRAEQWQEELRESAPGERADTDPKESQAA